MSSTSITQPVGCHSELEALAKVCDFQKRLIQATKTVAEERKVQLQALREEFIQYKAEVSGQAEQQSAALARLQQGIESGLRKEVVNATRQLEAYISVQGYLQTGAWMPGMHGWPVSPDFAQYLIELIENGNYDLVIEFGSGTSTLLVAKALNNIALRNEGRPAARHIAFEHLERFHAETGRSLARAGLKDSVQLMLAPLVPYLAPNGVSYEYYGCQQAIADLAAEFAGSAPQILVLVDGPPAATGKHARYPALAVVLECFGAATIDVLLDDYIRSDEQEIAQKWAADLDAAGIPHEMTTTKMEKDACLISIRQRKEEAR